MKEIDVQLFTACEKGSLDTVKKTIMLGADVNAENHHQFISLHIAARAGYVDIVDHLLDCGASIEARNQNDNTPLHSAAYGNQPAMIIKLIKRGASLSAVNKDGDTPLHSAAWKGNTDAVITLLQYKADINSRNNDGDSPLHLATWNNHTSTMRALIQKGANLEAASNSDETPLHLAVAKGHLAAFALLLTNSANVRAQNKKNETIFDMQEWSSIILNMTHFIQELSAIYLRKLSNPCTLFELDFFYFINKIFFTVLCKFEIISQSSLISNSDKNIGVIFQSKNEAIETILANVFFMLPDFKKEIGLSDGYRKKCSILLKATGFFKPGIELFPEDKHCNQDMVEKEFDKTLLLSELVDNECFKYI
ncbi:Ankyrin repeat protein [Legionella quinlivanii]|uniref:Ankyrin repeat protein n=1 Tax=Legionella quinlivanii TaxID=45073 RepID=A0A0W0XTY2_9GAMM|nr:ankyrin repeat domain-containing protein [Legionella quinlivanii]KTD48075.1 Ankyrin repeat protein [Legionella quinlivanii]SEG48502.1 Ankyrin repeat [Legionella quinlivanii DSM 21216]STY49791.1 Ankyrin repeat protein [Legionella quinlivanii]